MFIIGQDMESISVLLTYAWNLTSSITKTWGEGTSLQLVSILPPLTNSSLVWEFVDW